jgi:three-Cys-motif partner protein
MTKSGAFFTEFKPHSKHKLLILEQYFFAWGHKLGMREGAGDAILYVDACAGRGEDEVGNHGSPYIAARAAAIAQENVSRLRAARFRIQVVAIEANRTHHKALSELLAPFGESVRTVRGTLDDHISSLEHEFPETPTLYFIDPFGIAPLRADLVRRALAGIQHEALLLFADQAALRHFGAIIAGETRAERKYHAAADARAQEMSLFAELDREADARVEALGQAAELSRESLVDTREHAVRIMNAAFEGESWLPVIEATPEGDRREALLQLYCARLRGWGATYVLRIPIVNTEGNRVYTLVHASKSAKAYVAMKAAVHHALEHSPLDAAIVEQMRGLIRCDLNAIISAVLCRFAAQRVRWTVDRADKDAPCVKNYVLEETKAFPFEMEDVKTRLKQYKQPGRTIIYAFPGPTADVD